MDALNDVKVTSKPVSSDDMSILLELLSYPVARVLVSCVADDFLIRRYAIAEAKTMNDRLATEGMDAIREVAEDLGVSSHLEEDRLSMYFADFLHHTAALRGKEWKLVNQEVKSGYIFLTKNKFSRVLEQALAEKIETELPLPISDEVLEWVKADVTELRALVDEMREKYRAKDFGEVTITKFPPCMRKLTSMAEKGENMPHAGRFALTTFLSALGMQNEEIVRTFFTSPDFDNSMTMYQVRHITGDGMGKKYSCPECSTMRTTGICVDMDALCNSGKIRHPLSYYRVKTMSRKQPVEEKEQKPEEKK